MASTRPKADCSAMKASRPKRASTPASKALARANGMRSMMRSNQPVMPQSVMSAALTMKAPTASPMPNPPFAPALASTAAPGVLQATITGWRSHNEGSSEPRPMPRPSAHIQEAVCAGDAPSACAAWKTMATELVKPTKTATKPALAAETDISRYKFLMAPSITTAWAAPKFTPVLHTSADITSN